MLKVLRDNSEYGEKNILNNENELSYLISSMQSTLSRNKDIEEEIDGSIFTIFENELGRTLSPMEFEQIKDWKTTYKNEELIIAALKESVLSGVSSFRYIDKILDDWNRKGYKTKEDIIKDKSNYRKKKSNIEAFDMDWLNDE